MGVNLDAYSEKKEHALKRRVWYVINRTIFRIVGWRLRHQLLVLFGAKVGRLCAIYRMVNVYGPWNLEIGDLVCLGPGVDIYNKGFVRVGNNVVVSQGAYICTASHDVMSPSMELVTKPIVISDQAWIAAKATILPGVTIGEGAVVGACAVVAKDVPSWSVVVGNPARFIKKRLLNAEA